MQFCIIERGRVREKKRRRGGGGANNVTEVSFLRKRRNFFGK
jgi:hypothetical protein